MAVVLASTVMFTAFSRAGWDLWCQAVLHAIFSTLALTYLLNHLRRRQTLELDRGWLLGWTAWLTALGFSTWLSVSPAQSRLFWWTTVDAFFLFFLAQSCLPRPTAVGRGSQPSLQTMHRILALGMSFLLLVGLYLGFTLKTIGRSPLLSANALAGYLIVILPVLYGGSQRDLKARPVYLTLCGAGLLLLCFTGSTSAWLALVGAMLLVMAGRRKVKLLSLPGLLALAAVAVPLAYKFHDPDWQNRLSWWRAALRLWRQAPWMGQGPGTFELVSPMASGSGLHSLFAHNSYLQLAAESGALGLLTLLILFTLIWKRLQDPPARVGALAFILHNGLDYTFFLPAHLLLFWLVVACHADRTAPVRFRFSPAWAPFLVFFWGAALMDNGRIFMAEQARARAMLSLKNEDIPPALALLNQAERWDALSAATYGLTALAWQRRADRENSLGARALAAAYMGKALERSPKPIPVGYF